MPRNLSIALVAIAIVGGGYLLRSSEAPSISSTGEVNTAAVKSFEAKAGEVVVTGNLKCAPQKEGASTGALECITGLSGNDGKFYTLDLTKKESSKGENLSKVRVVGTLSGNDVLVVRTIEAN